MRAHVAAPRLGRVLFNVRTWTYYGGWAALLVGGDAQGDADSEFNHCNQVEFRGVEGDGFPRGSSDEDLRQRWG